MKANFDKSRKNKTTKKSEVFEGGFEKMMKERKAKMPELEATVQELLDDWNGETLCIIKIHEDENGDPSGTHIFQGGVSKVSSQMALGKALVETAESIAERMSELAASDPRTGKHMVEDLLEQILKDLKKG